MDIWSKEKRSEIMARIRGKNTNPEKLLRKLLFSNGFRYRLNVASLPGKPDIVLRKYSVIVFVQGCFWHLHENCQDGKLPKSRTQYWKEKLNKTKERDRKNISILQSEGWRVIEIWECEIETKPIEIMETLNRFILKEIE